MLLQRCEGASKSHSELQPGSNFIFVFEVVLLSPFCWTETRKWLWEDRKSATDVLHINTEKHTESSGEYELVLSTKSVNYIKFNASKTNKYHTDLANHYEQESFTFEIMTEKICETKRNKIEVGLFLYSTKRINREIFI